MKQRWIAPAVAGLALLAACVADPATGPRGDDVGSLGRARAVTTYFGDTGFAPYMEKLYPTSVRLVYLENAPNYGTQFTHSCSAGDAMCEMWLRAYHYGLWGMT